MNEGCQEGSPSNNSKNPFVNSIHKQFYYFSLAQTTLIHVKLALRYLLNISHISTQDTVILVYGIVNYGTNR
jgi:hypothetical protein